MPTEFGRKVLFETKDSKEEEEKACIKFLQDNGSLFDPYLSNIHSFTNYFLFYLRHENFDGYKAIVGKTYGIAFISNEAHTFYRKDTRNSATIFANGFRLKKASNQYSTRKHKYRQPYTNSHGISLSKSILSITKYKGTFYTVSLPQGHSLLLIDICASPCNKNNLNQNRKKLQEVNSMDPIPREYIYMSCKNNNSHFSENPVTPPRTYRGCY